MNFLLFYKKYTIKRGGGKGGTLSSPQRRGVRGEQIKNF
jgi:hypothetical protein